MASYRDMMESATFGTQQVDSMDDRPPVFQYLIKQGFSKSDIINACVIALHKNGPEYTVIDVLCDVLSKPFFILDTLRRVKMISRPELKFYIKGSDAETTNAKLVLTIRIGPQKFRFRTI